VGQWEGERKKERLKKQKVIWVGSTRKGKDGNKKSKGRGKRNDLVRRNLHLISVAKKSVGRDGYGRRGEEARRNDDQLKNHASSVEGNSC